MLTSDYLSCASRLVVADLIIKIFFQNVSDAELLLTIINGGQRISDVHYYSSVIQWLHSETHSADVTWGQDQPTVMLRLHAKVDSCAKSQFS